MASLCKDCCTKTGTGAQHGTLTDMLHGQHTAPPEKESARMTKHTVPCYSTSHVAAEPHRKLSLLLHYKHFFVTDASISESLSHVLQHLQHAYCGQSVMTSSFAKWASTPDSLAMALHGEAELE